MWQAEYVHLAFYIVTPLKRTLLCFYPLNVRDSLTIDEVFCFCFLAFHANIVCLHILNDDRVILVKSSWEPWIITGRHWMIRSKHRSSWDSGRLWNLLSKGNKQKTNKINLNQIILILYINGMNIQIKQIIRIDKNAGSNYMLAIRLHFQYKET